MNQKKPDLNIEITEKSIHLTMLFHSFWHKNRRSMNQFGNRFQGQGKILSILEENPIISQKALTKRLDMRAQSASEMISKLEKKGYLKRYKDEYDRRVMIVEITEDGKKAIQEESLDDFNPIMLKNLTQEEKESFLHILNKVIDNMEEELDEKDIRRNRFLERRR